jgi:UDP-N-acetylglucosamine--N-acetylmuramyl-(pentapeptide) pyrophosphoryl-undecaprenol N-acetylglucosamine transferase
MTNVSLSPSILAVPNSDSSHAQTAQSAPVRLLVAASGTGGHLFPALAVAQVLEQGGYQVEWLGVRNRLETQLIPNQYRLHIVAAEGFQTKLSLNTLRVTGRLVKSFCQTRRLLTTGQFDGVVTTGGYIAGPAILAARSLGLPSILHESNALPGKVTRFLSRWCSAVALGFEAATPYLPQANTVVVGTPVRANFLQPCSLDLPIPEKALLIVVAGGSQGAVAVNQLVRQCAGAWIQAGAWIVHLTGDRDPDIAQFQDPHYLALPFYENMAALFQRADLVIGRAGAGTLTELAITGTPSILIPYPYAAEDHQAFNARVFEKAGAAQVVRQSEVTGPQLEQMGLDLVRSPQTLAHMSAQASSLAVPDSTQQLAHLVRQHLEGTSINKIKDEST